MMFLLAYVAIGVVTAVAFTLAMIPTVTGYGSVETGDWWICGLFGLCAGMVWPLTLVVWGIVVVAKRIYYASREESNV